MRKISVLILFFIYSGYIYSQKQKVFWEKPYWKIVNCYISTNNIYFLQKSLNKVYLQNDSSMYIYTYAHLDATKKNKLKSMQCIENKILEISKKTYSYEWAFSVACQYSKPKTIQYLITKHNNTLTENDKTNFYMNFIFYNNKYKTCKWVLNNYKLNVNKKMDNGNTLIMLAILSKKQPYKKVILLLNNGANIYLKNYLQKTAYDYIEDSHIILPWRKWKLKRILKP
jgi:hypothetical protein